MSEDISRLGAGWLCLGVLLALAAACLVAPVSADSPGEGAVNITVEPAETNANPGETTTYEVVVEGAGDGIDGYAHLDIVIEEPSVAQFVAVNETAADNVEGGLPYSLTEIQNASGNASETGPVVSMEAALTGGAAFDGAEEIVIAELQVEVLGDSPRATNLSIVETPEPEPIDEPQIARNTAGDAYDVTGLGDSELVVPAGVDVSLVAADETLPPGQSTSYEVVVEDAGYGLGGYSGIEIAIDNPDSGMFVDFTETATDNVDPGGDPPVSNSEIRDANGNPAQTGSVVYLDADLADGAFDGAEEIVVAELDTVVTGIDTSPVSLTVETGLRDTDGVEYTVENTTGSVLEPVGIDVNGNGEPATDMNGDGKFEDVDGDGAFTIFDVQAFFLHFDSSVVQDNPGPFSFNEQSGQTVSIFDVQSLFADLAG